jgi:predicted MFS family arabinose efflux permease
MTPLWRNRDFTLLWSGQVISSLGAAISSTATPLLVLSTTGSPLDAGLVGAAGTLPHLIANLPAGPLVDRWNRRRILLISEIVAGVALLSIPLAIWSGLFTIAQLCVVAFLQGVCFVFFGLAQDAALPMVVPPDQLATAIAADEARSRGATLAGPPIGGALFGLDRAAPFLVDGISYLIAAAALLFLRRDLQKPAEGPAEPLWRAAVTGLRYVWHNPLIRVSLLLIAASNFVFQALILVLVVLAGRQGGTASDIGLMLGLYSAGGLLGAFAASRLHRMVSFRGALVGVNWVWALLLPLFLLTTAPWQIGVVGALTAFVGPLWNVVIFTYAGVVVPNELLGRVMSAAGTLTWGVMPIASLTGGLMLTAIGTTGSLWSLSAIMLIAAVAATLSPSVRRTPTQPEPIPQPQP